MCIHKGNKRLPSVHILGDFNFCDIDWPDRLSKSGPPLRLSEGEKFIEILNDHHLEQLVHFPTREKNTLNLIITSLPSQFLDIQSPDGLSDHDIDSGTLKIVVRIHGRNLWQEISMGSLNQKFNFCIQDGRCQTQ